MEIVFRLHTEIIADEDIGFRNWMAVLFVESEIIKLSFTGINPAKTEALRLAFQSFLDDWNHHTNSGYMEEPRFRLQRIVTPGAITKITIEHFDREYQELIWQLIDAKFGDNYIKISA